MPLVSVVMCSYNHEKFVSDAIESVFGQDFDDLELIIVDDASTDSSRQIIQKYAEEDARVRVILHETNCGIAKTINDGIAIAQGMFLGYIDSDDVWMKDKLGKQLAVLESNEDLIVWTGGEHIDESGRIFATWSEPRRGDSIHEVLAWHLFASSKLLKRENLSELRLDEHLKYANDIKFYFDLAARYEFYFIPEPLTQYRIHSSNVHGMKGPQGEERRINHQENVVVLEYALNQYQHLMSAENKALALETLGFHYYKLGQNGKALTCFCRAIAADPFRRSNLEYPRYFTAFIRNVLGNEILER